MLSRSLNATTNVPRDGSMSGCMVGSILTQIQEVQAAYKNLGKSYCAFASANAGSGKRMPEVVNSFTETMIPVKLLQCCSILIN